MPPDRPTSFWVPHDFDEAPGGLCWECGEEMLHAYHNKVHDLAPPEDEDGDTGS